MPLFSGGILRFISSPETIAFPEDFLLLNAITIAFPVKLLHGACLPSL